jgi:hypothetical protein
VKQTEVDFELTNGAWAAAISPYLINDLPQTYVPNSPCQLSLWEETRSTRRKPTTFGRALTFYSFRMRTGFESHWEVLTEISKRWKASALTTSPPKPQVIVLCFLSEFMLICARSRWLSSLYFCIISNRPIGIAEMKRAATMNNS